MALKRYKQLAAGVVIGSLLTGAGAALADNQTVTAYTAPMIKFLFNGEQKPLPEDYTVLVYKDRTYVPARFVAESLGAKVGWDEAKQAVLIDQTAPAVTPPPANQPAPPATSSSTDPSTPSSQPGIQYQKIPVSQTVNGVRIEVYAVSAESNKTTFYLNIKNTTSNPMKFKQEETYLEADGKTYKQANVDTATILNPYDQTWFNDIREDQEIEGFVVLPPLEGETQGTLHLKVIQNDRTQKESNFTFNLSWEK